MGKPEDGQATPVGQGDCRAGRGRLFDRRQHASHLQAVPRVGNDRRIGCDRIDEAGNRLHDEAANAAAGGRRDAEQVGRPKTGAREFAERTCLGRFDLDHALLADDLDLEINDVGHVVRQHPAVFQRDHGAVFKLQHGDMHVGRIDALRGEEAAPHHGLHALDLGAHDEAQGIDGVTAEEPKRRRLAGPGKQLERHEQRVGQTGRAMQRQPDIAGGDRIAKGDDGRADAIVEVHHHLAATAVGGVGNRFGLGQRGRQRLFAHHMLAGLDRRQHDIAMGEIGRRHGDGVDIGIGEQFAIIGVGLGRAELLLHVGDAGRVEIADSGQLGAVDGAQRLAMERAPEARSDHAEANFTR
jgi:hypothetical protein